jgi:hypothetical protein
MFMSKLKVGAAVVLALMILGTGLGVFAVRAGGGKPPEPPPPEPPPTVAKENARPPLPKEWEGKWVANPFAGAVSIDVRHGALPPGTGRAYVIKDSDAVAALVKAAKVTAVHNDMFPSSIPPAELTVLRQDGTTFQAGVEDGHSLSCTTGLVYVSEDFFTALNLRLSEQEKAPVVVTQFLPPPVQPAPPPVKASDRSLTAGFTALTVGYSVDARLHRARFTDEKTLDRLHKALLILKHEPAPVGKVGGNELTITSKDKSVFHGHLESGTEFFDFDAGQFTVQPAFLEAVGKEVNRLEGRDIELLAENPLTPQQAKRGTEFRELLAGVRALRFTTAQKDGSRTVVVDRPEEAAGFIKGLSWVEVPVVEPKVAKGERLVELTLKDGKAVDVTLLKTGDDNEAVGVAPLMGDLVEVAGFGPVWIDNQWKYRFPTYVQAKEREAKERADQETAELVCRDLPAFVKQVINAVAAYREGESQLTEALSADRSRPILEALAGSKYERLDWTREHWQKELDDLSGRGAGGLDLAPGLGFSLPVVITGDREMLILMCGKLTFARSPIDTLRKAINGEKPDAVELLPRPKGKE